VGSLSSWWGERPDLLGELQERGPNGVPPPAFAPVPGPMFGIDVLYESGFSLLSGLAEMFHTRSDAGAALLEELTGAGERDLL